MQNRVKKKQSTYEGWEADPSLCRQAALDTVRGRLLEEDLMSLLGIAYHPGLDAIGVVRDLLSCALGWYVDERCKCLNHWFVLSVIEEIFLATLVFRIPH